MINEPIEIFNKYSFSQAIQDKFYGRILEYMDFVLPALIKGKHTIDNEMECVGSQYLHLYYVPTNDPNCNFIVYRYEQGKDLIFINKKRLDSHSVTVLYGAEEISEKIEQGYLKKNRKGQLVFDDLKGLSSFIRENRESLANDEHTTKEILNGNDKTFIFRVDSGYKNIIPIRVTNNYYTYNFSDQLRIFSLCNTLLCGVSENENKKIPKKFIDDVTKVSNMMDKLKKQLPKEKE